MIFDSDNHSFPGAPRKLKNLQHMKIFRARAVAATTALSVVPILVISVYTLSPTIVEAGSDSDLCITATRNDDSKIFSQRGNCPVPTPSPTATTSPTATETPTPTAAPVAVNNFASFTWTSKTLPVYNIAGSADGTKMIYTNSSDYDIYTSTDSGETWVKRLATSGINHMYTAVSQDGTKMLSTGYSGPYTADTLWRSTNSGVTWTKVYTGSTWNQGASFFKNLKISKDGSTMTVEDSSSPMSLISYDGGTTWGNMLRHLPNVVMSGDGKILFGGKTTSTIYKRVNGGAWVTMPSPTGTSVAVTGVQMSADGNTILLTTGTSFHISRDGGSTWEQHPELGAKSWSMPTVSDDASKMTMLADGLLYVSVDSGKTWGTVNYPVTSTTSFTLSPNGDRITATQSGKWWIGK